MGAFQIISGFLLLLSSLFIIIVVLVQDNKDQGMSSAITGASNDSFYGKNNSRTKEAKISKMTRNAAIIFFIITLIVNISARFIK